MSPGSSPCQCLSVPGLSYSHLQAPHLRPLLTGPGCEARVPCRLFSTWPPEGALQLRPCPSALGVHRGLAHRPCSSRHHVVPCPCLAHLPSITALATPAACPHRPPLELCPLLSLLNSFSLLGSQLVPLPFRFQLRCHLGEAFPRPPHLSQ